MTCTEAYEEHIMYSFNGFCKVVIRYAAINAWRERSRQRQREISFEYLTEEKFYPFSTSDEYFADPYKAHFPGHQALVCTHPDGHNHSGNIHVHIVINSLRIEEVPLLPYMDRPADTKAGCKHRCTDAAMEYLKAEVMEMCHRENLY